MNVVRRPTVDELRELVGAVGAEANRERLAWPIPVDGSARPELVLGSVAQLVGPGKTTLCAELLRGNPDLSVAWIEPELSIYPLALAQAQAGLPRILFIECGHDLASVVTQALQAQVFDLLVVGGGDATRAGAAGSGVVRDFTEKELRRFQLLSEKAQALTLLLRDEPVRSWVIRTTFETGG